MDVIRNDNAPAFQKGTYLAVIDENVDAGRQITAVKADDRDAQVQCVFTYVYHVILSL